MFVSEALDVGLPALLVDWVQVISAVLSLLAIVIALYALWKQKRDIAKERRLQHDLEILRDIGSLANLKEKRLEVYRLLDMLPDSDFPLTREALKAPPFDEASDDFRRYYEAFAAAHEMALPPSNIPNWMDYWDAVIFDWENDRKSLLWVELQEANAKRFGH
jgi:hypothetical protein